MLGIDGMAPGKPRSRGSAVLTSPRDQSWPSEVWYNKRWLGREKWGKVREQLTTAVVHGREQ